jgi:hypothetical protein
MFVQEYFEELQKGMIQWGVVDDPELFQFAMLAEKKLQGR